VLRPGPPAAVLNVYSTYNDQLSLSRMLTISSRLRPRRVVVLTLPNELISKRKALPGRSTLYYEGHDLPFAQPVCAHWQPHQVLESCGLDYDHRLVRPPDAGFTP
jgi:hypothetical protein